MIYDADIYTSDEMAVKDAIQIFVWLPRKTETGWVWLKDIMKSQPGSWMVDVSGNTYEPPYKYYKMSEYI